MNIAELPRLPLSWYSKILYHFELVSRSRLY